MSKIKYPLKSKYPLMQSDDIKSQDEYWVRITFESSFGYGGWQDYKVRNHDEAIYLFRQEEEYEWDQIVDMQKISLQDYKPLQ